MHNYEHNLQKNLNSKEGLVNIASYLQTIYSLYFVQNCYYNNSGYYRKALEPRFNFKFFILPVRRWVVLGLLVRF